jgi:hypothetical protein
MDGFIYDELDHPPALADDDEAWRTGATAVEDGDEEMQGLPPPSRNSKLLRPRRHFEE